ncbi:MAG: cytochrome c [Bacteroidota bacterium]|nr:cytochrome c [Bacteroidota bacterium]MXW14483.1 cytochrome c [Rhodothermaceae bacterium]MDE2645754.1 cytochrome c [Bacteroidota bacterium]MXW32016.1 cytochrome c [Rhodothermaceae bacterium]MXZ16884.1 cytochrome c [Rhodothermaceae bacterium]
MKKLSFLLGIALLLGGCRGSLKEDPPIHINPNMDAMERFEAQEANPFFEDGRAMRPPVPGTVARGMLREDVAFHTGRNADGGYVQVMPVEYTVELANRGRERYDIYCSVCHGVAGDGQGIVMTGGYGFVPIGFHNDRLRTIEDGYLYEVISQGVRTMPAYAQQIPIADRWAIVAYVRALQHSQNADRDDIPADEQTNF